MALGFMGFEGCCCFLRSLVRRWVLDLRRGLLRVRVCHTDIRLPLVL